MNRPIPITLLSLPLALAACTTEPHGRAEPPRTGSSTATAASRPTTAPPAAGWRGRVLELMDSGGYTYALLDAAGGEVWIAGPQTPGLAIGETVSTEKGLAMTGFRSGTLDRTFAEIWFVSAIEREGAAPPAADGQPASREHAGDAPAPIAKVDGGFTIAEILTQRKELAGQPIKVRAKVVKFNANIMGTNWAHVQDGSGEDGAADLTITTDAMLEVGDVVVVEGTLVVDKDLGAGYHYDAIVEDAKVTKE